MLYSDSYASMPGISTSKETYENSFQWGSQFLAIIAPAIIDGATIDAGNSPTYLWRAGLVLGQVTATGKYKNYSATATDGSEVACAVLMEGMRGTDLTNTAQDKFYGVLVGGPVKAGNLFGLDANARQQMDKFNFDDAGQLVGGHWFPWKRFVNKTAAYSILTSDNYTMFDNAGAAGTVILTLPAIAPGLMFGLRAEAAQVLRFTSNESSNVVGTSATNSSVSVTAIGGVIWIYSNPAGTKWIVEQHGTQTITAA